MPTTQRRLSHAQGYLTLGMLNEAAIELDHIAGPDAQSIEVLSMRLAVLHEQEKWPAARDLARELVRRDPKEAAGWISWAYATRRSESIEAAEKILVQSEVHHPKEPTIQFNLGCYACQRGDLVEAKTRVQRAIKLDEKFALLAATDPDLAALRAADGTDCQTKG